MKTREQMYSNLQQTDANKIQLLKLAEERDMAFRAVTLIDNLISDIKHKLIKTDLELLKGSLVDKCFLHKSFEHDSIYKIISVLNIDRVAHCRVIHLTDNSSATEQYFDHYFSNKSITIDEFNSRFDTILDKLLIIRSK